MPTKTDWKTSLAICAAIIGAGFASGREIVSFFAGLGSASWLGVITASVVSGLLIYVIMHLAQHTRARTLPCIYDTLMGKRCREAVSVLHGLLCLCAASAMLSAGAELGALTFPVPHSHALGLALTLCAALASLMVGLDSLSVLGGVLTGLTVLYYAAIASGSHAAPSFSTDGLFLTVPLGVLYASFNVALVGGTICLSAHQGASPARTARLTGFLLFVLIACANRALLGAEDNILRAALPAVLLTARWGLIGYYSTIVCMWLAVLTTLCAMLHSLSALLSETGMTPRKALILGVSASCALSVCGFEMIVNTAYPLLGWVCTVALVVLMLFLPEKNTSSE